MPLLHHNREIKLQSELGEGHQNIITPEEVCSGREREGGEGARDGGHLLGWGRCVVLGGGGGGGGGGSSQSSTFSLATSCLLPLMALALIATHTTTATPSPAMQVVLTSHYLGLVMEYAPGGSLTSFITQKFRECRSGQRGEGGGLAVA